MNDDTASAEQSEAVSAPVVFKKRRKLVHHFVRRTDDDPENSGAGAASKTEGNTTAITKDLASADTSEDVHQEPVLRRPAKHPPKWKTVMTVSSRATESSLTTTALAAALKPQNASDPIAGRFVKPSGEVLNADDKLLNEFIEAGMREWRKNPDGPLPNPWELVRGSGTAPSSSSLVSSHPTMLSSRLSNAASRVPDKPSDTVSTKRNPKDATADERQAASIGKLIEVDLGPEARLENIRRTEAAIKRMMGVEPVPDSEEGQRRGKKRGRGGQAIKRRNSADQERDKKIEEFMKDAPLFHFELDRPALEPDAPTDDLLAEQFQREFLESQENNIRAQKKPQEKAGAKGVEERAKGPKLGGSRSARALMREREEKEKEGKKREPPKDDGRAPLRRMKGIICGGSCAKCHWF